MMYNDRSTQINNFVRQKKPAQEVYEIRTVMAKDTLLNMFLEISFESKQLYILLIAFTINNTTDMRASEPSNSWSNLMDNVF